jgi:capsule polysaccharide modification protein KpsS
VFITSPVEVEPRYDSREIPEILSVLLRKASGSGRKLVVRVHPTENVSTYRALIDEQLQGLDPKPDVSFSQRTPIDSVVRSAAVVVLFNSTVFLNCLAAGAPMISPGWHDFPFKDEYIQEKVFNFANDLKHLAVLVQKGLNGELEYRPERLERFLRPTRSAEVTHFLESTRRMANTR